MRRFQSPQCFSFIMRNIDTCDARDKCVPTNGRVFKRLKLLDGKLLCHRRKSAAAPSKLQNPKRILLTPAPRRFRLDLVAAWHWGCAIPLRFLLLSSLSALKFFYACQWHPSRCLYHRFSIVSRAAPGWQTIQCRCFVHRSRGRIPPEKSYSQRALATASFAP